jgi:hypothetical protein
MLLRDPYPLAHVTRDEWEQQRTRQKHRFATQGIVPKDAAKHTITDLNRLHIVVGSELVRVHLGV